MNDVTIEFASSLNNDGSFKIYHVVAGSTFSFCYNETLDSATVLLSQVNAVDRLSKLKPFEYVSVYNAETNKRHTYLVDNFNEVEDNIHEHKFSYTINLMSETKILEKIQCPNVAITHRVENGSMSRKTIYELICQYMELYCPKVKFTDDGSTWYYKPIVEVPVGGSFYNRFNVTSADLALTTPTMRQLLTTLMQQVGCIPTVENGVLGFLDFQAEPTPFGYMKNNHFVEDFTVKNTVNKITRSLSSDSYANSLVDMSSNVLDSNNEVICETLGFRDKNNTLLRQKENLKLETKFPIYKVNEFKINFIAMEKNVSGFNYNLNASFNPKTYFNSSNDDLNFNVVLSGEITNLQGYFDDEGFLKEQAFNSAKIVIKDEYLSSARLDNAILKGKLHIIYFENEWKDLVVVDISSTLPTTGNFNFIETTLGDGIGLTRDTIKKINVFYGTFYFEGTLEFYDSNEGDSFPQPVTVFLSDIQSASLLFTVDITPLIVENSQRQLLKTNFLDSDYVQANTIEQLSKYIYGTVGYSIGSNEISGFSTTFTKAETTIFGPITQDFTYIENIETFLLRIMASGNVNFTVTHLQGIPVVTDTYKGVSTSIHFTSLSNFTSQYFANLVNFVTCFFDIKYQPLNSFALSFVKQREELDYMVEQFSSGANGLTDFDRLSIHQQETVDRIGNETLVIHQRTKDFNDIQLFGNAPRYFKDDLSRDGDLDDEDEDIKHIVFKIEYSINDYFYTVSYTAAKDSILKNYFTSIRTKYRAYRYVGYNESVLRKEKDLVFVRIGEDYYNGDDRIYLPNGDYEHFIDGCVHYGKSYQGNISYAAEKGDRVSGSSSITTIAKNDVSIITNSNSFALIYENMDNVGPGSYITNSTFDKSLEYSDLTNWNEQKVGGVPQSWIIWDDSYNEAHEVFFLKYLKFYETDMFSEGTLNGRYLKIALYDSEVLKEAAQMPIVDTNYMLTSVDQYAFYVVDDNTNTSNLVRTFYKDYSERINHTVQFIYYRSSDSVRWTEHFIKNNSFVDQENFISVGYKEDSGYSDFDADDWFNEEDHIDIPGSNIHYLGNVVTIDTTGVVPCIKVNWSGISADYIKVVGVFGGSIGGSYTQYYDLIAFKNPGDGSTKRYYITLNDTKSDYVMAKQSNVLYRKSKVKTNTLVRDIKTN